MNRANFEEFDIEASRAINIAFENGKKKGREELARELRALLDIGKPDDYDH